MKILMVLILVFFMLGFACDADEDVYFGKGPSFAKTKDEIRECFSKNNIRETEFITDNGNLFFVAVTIGSGIARDNVYGYYKNQDGGYYILFIYFVANAKGTTFTYDSDTKIVKLVSYDKQILLTIPVLPVFKYNTTRPVTTLDVQQIKKAVEFDIREIKHDILKQE